MTLDEHISIATVALAQGLIDSRTFVEVMHHLHEPADPRSALPSAEELWMTPGRLSRDQLSTLADSQTGGAAGSRAILTEGALVPGGDTLPFSSFSGAGARELALGTSRRELADFVSANTERGARVGSPGGFGATGDAEAGLEVSPKELAANATRLVRTSAQARAAKSRAQTAARPLPAQMPVRTDAHTEVGPGITARAPAPAVLERYEREASLGAGGLGEVSACRDGLLGRIVAVKSARNGAADPEAQAILQREARIIAGLEHPNIIPVYDAGFHDENGPYYVMRVVHQPSLDQVLARLRSGDGDAAREYGLKRLLRYFVQICRAVDFAHSRGVIHCDLKPANTLLGEFGEVLVVDWGLAHSVHHPGGPRGGTPGFMAPEQFAHLGEDFDARTDVFALGAMLYQLISLRPAFPVWSTRESAETGTGADSRSGEGAPYPAPAPPSDYDTPWLVPAEVEEICLHALALEPELRWPSARALADAIDDYLEGTRELERRQAEADKCAETGDDLAERYHEFVESRPDDLAELAQIRNSTPTWAEVDSKTELWNAEDMLKVTDALRVRTMQAAQSAYEQAIESMPSHAGARRGLARLYRSELERARRERHELNQIYFEGLVRQYDDGGAGFSDSGSDGQLVLEAGRDDLRLTLCKLAEQDRRLVPTECRRFEPVQLSLQSGSARPQQVSMPENLPAGSYVLEATLLEVDGTETTAIARYPLLIQGGEQLSVSVDPTPALSLADGEIFVPGGPALLGDRGAGDSNAGVGAQLVTVDGFFIRRLPVTFGEYLEFLDAVRASDASRLDELVPQSALGIAYWRLEDGRWQASCQKAGQRDSEQLQGCPAFGVSSAAATEYARWRAELLGLNLRLPRDSEWEKAARGTDGRRYPWGDYFDATFCKMRQSRPGEPQPEPAGLFDSDESPYGVRDMAGGIANWTVPDRFRPRDDDELEARLGIGDAIYSRGGAWCDWPRDCSVTARRSYLVGERTHRVGVRLVRSAT